MSGLHQRNYSPESEEKSLLDNSERNFKQRYLCAPSCSQFCKHRKERVPSGKAVYLTLLICLFERIAFYGSLANILSPLLSQTNLSPVEQAFVQAIAKDVVAQILYPIAGWLADVWIGRYRAIHVSLWILWVGYTSLALSFSVLNYWTALHYFLPVGFLLTSVGIAGFQSNIIPFGADQIVNRASEEELSSYFYWYYWVRNLGGTMVIFSITCDSHNIPTGAHVSTFAVISAASITIALSLNAIFKNWFIIDQERRNPMKIIARVLYSAITATQPQARSISSTNDGRETPTSRMMDRAKSGFGGRFSNEEVEDVKTFLRLLLVLLAIGGSFVVYTGVTSIMALQVRHMKHGNFLKFNVSGTCHLSDESFWGINVLTILIVIPILDQGIFPWLRDCTPSTLKNIGIGYFLALLSSLILFLFEGLGGHSAWGCVFAEGEERSLEMSAYMALIPNTAVNIAEIFLVVSALEFFYVQSPHNMQGMMIGLFFAVKGIFSTLAVSVLFSFSQRCTESQLNAAPHVDCGFWYYLIFLIVGLLSFVLYILVSRWYKYRQRGELEE